MIRQTTEEINRFMFSCNVKEPSNFGAMKGKIFILTFICILLIIGFTYYAYQMDRDPKISIYDDSILISHFYGLRVDFSDITEVSLIDRNEQRIYMGHRTNGGIGRYIARGHFKGGLFLMHLKTPLTIRIMRRKASTIYVNCRNNAQTEQVYNLLKEKYYKISSRVHNGLPLIQQET